MNITRGKIVIFLCVFIITTYILSVSNHPSYNAYRGTYIIPKISDFNLSSLLHENPVYDEDPEPLSTETIIPIQARPILRFSDLNNESVPVIPLLRFPTDFSSDVYVPPQIPKFRRSTPLQHIAFIKTHKCASSTIQNILMRYGMTNQLTFILPKGTSNHIGYPAPFNPAKHMRPVAKTPDIFCYHSVYSPKLADVLPEDTFYLSAVRDPFTQIRSTYIYYSWYGCTKHNLSEIVSVMETKQGFCSIVAFNPVIFDLGLPKTAMLDSEEVDKYIKMLDRRFNLVMVVEYFDESLIILRDMLGWTNNDILSFAVNFRQDKSGTKKVAKPGVDLDDTLENRALVYNVQQADSKLYLHFKRKLEQIIAENKSYIMQEKEKLLKIRMQWMEFCISKSVLSSQVKDPRFRTYGNGAYGYVLTPQGMLNQTCVDLATAELPFVHRIHNYQPAAL